MYYEYGSVNMFYAKGDDYHIVVIIDNYDFKLRYVIIFNNSDANIIYCENKIRRSVEYAIYTYLKNGRTDLIKKWAGKGSKKFFKLLNILNICEKNNDITIYDKKLYDFIKSIIIMYSII
jgi:hypothetical protein